MTDQDTQNGERTELARAHEADVSWSRTQPLYIQPSSDRLDRPHQIVDIKNNSDVEVGTRGIPVPTKHVVIDRFNQGHEIMPGETKRGVDMLADDIKYFARERMPGRVDHMNRIKPKHPIEILGFNPERAIPEQAAELVAERKRNREQVGEREERPARREREGRERPSRNRE